MEVIYAPKAIEHLNYWKKSGNKAIQKKIQQLILAIQENPFEGIGKPEPLKYDCPVLGLEELMKNTELFMKFTITELLS